MRRDHVRRRLLIGLAMTALLLVACGPPTEPLAFRSAVRQWIPAGSSFEDACAALEQRGFEVTGRLRSARAHGFVDQFTYEASCFVFPFAVRCWSVTLEADEDRARVLRTTVGVAAP